MKKMYYTTEPKKDNMILHIIPNKGRVQFKTTRASVYSKKQKAQRKEDNRLKNMLRKGEYQL